MRSLVAVVGLALVSVMAACGDDVSPPTDSTPATSGVARTPVPDPGMPDVLLLIPVGTPEPLDRMCVEISLERGVMDGDEAARMVSRALELLGIELVDGDCRAALSITATGGRQMARYSVGQCWTGWDYSIETELTVDRMPQASWSEDDGQSPPGTIDVSDCTPEGALVLDSNYGHTYLDPAFGEMFGNLGLFAIEAARGGYRIPEGLEVSDDVLQLIATGLLAEPITADFYDELPLWFVLGNWTRPSTTGGEPDPRIAALHPLTPYLITLLESEDGALKSDAARNPAAYVELSFTLQNITGQFGESQDLASPAEWWTWWDTQ